VCARSTPISSPPPFYSRRQCSTCRIIVRRTEPRLSAKGFPMGSRFRVHFDLRASSRHSTTYPDKYLLTTLWLWHTSDTLCHLCRLDNASSVSRAPFCLSCFRADLPFHSAAIGCTLPHLRTRRANCPSIFLGAVGGFVVFATKSRFHVIMALKQRFVIFFHRIFCTRSQSHTYISI